ncbi:hypothetical protein IGI04_028144 [Brassica rapa subsp. trilocularis]|uniref:Uncharacterized protein n=1 Tax=Brassica rapa subsp. trilocularis TaxID=1813537 RepID=A0ABQ7L142_BRACM|nr:hypothetical protein IGI04_028144 [Brassica rapa subsp. trilocularis]
MAQFYNNLVSIPIYLASLVLFSLPLQLSPPPCLSSGSGLLCGGSGFGVKTRSGEGSVGRSLGFFSQWMFRFSGDRGSFSSVAAGSCLREERLLQLRRRRLCSPGGEGFLNLASPVCCSSPLVRFLISLVVCGCLLREQSVKEKRWSRWRLCGLSELLASGGVSPATSRDGEGQVDAEVTRTALMGRYPYTCRASLSRGPSEVARA